MTDQGRNRRNQRRGNNAPQEREEPIPGPSLKYATIVVIIGIVVVIFIRVNNHFSTSTTFSENTPARAGKSRYEGRGQGKSEMLPYEAESKAMKRIISRYTSTKGAGEKNYSADPLVGKTGTFMLESEDKSDDSGKANKESDGEQKYENLDEVDLAFVDNMLHDIQETEVSKAKIQMEQRVNELERELGRKLTIYRMTPEELDADTTLDEDERQTLEFRNVRQGFIDIWVKRMRELKSENYEKYFRLPENYNMDQKVVLLKRHFEAYVEQYWDKDTMRQKRRNPTKPVSNQQTSAKQKEGKNISPEMDEDREIKEMLEAIHFTPEYERKQELEEELEDIKRTQGFSPPKISNIEHIKNNFVYSEREKLGFTNKKSPSDYSFIEIEELKAAWKEYFQFFIAKHENNENGEESGLTLDELDQMDDFIEAIERTPSYLSKERERKEWEEWDKNRHRSQLFNANPGDTEKDMAETIVNVIQKLKDCNEAFIKEERIRLNGKDGEGSKKMKGEIEYDDEYDEYSLLRNYRQPEEYSLEEKEQLKKRYDLFKRRYFAEKPLLKVAREERPASEIFEAIKNTKIDFTDELIEDIHNLRTPGAEARLDFESFTAKSLKIVPGDRRVQLQIEYYQMRRKFIAEERARLVTKFTKSKTPGDYTEDEKDEIQCRWVYFHDKNWSMEKQKEIEEHDKKLEGTERKKKTKEEIEEENNGLDKYELELVHHLIDEIYNQDNFEYRKQWVEEYNKEIEDNWKLKEQLIRQSEGVSVTAEDKIIRQFAQTSLAEFLKMREEFILQEKEMAKEKTKGVKQFYFKPSDMVDLLNRWNAKFVTYKTKVDKMFKNLGK